MSQNMFNVLFSGKSQSERPFLVVPDGQTLSYRDCYDRSGQIANVLVNLGVEPGDRVAVQVDKCADAICLYLACLRVGGVFLPLNTAYVESEIEYFLKDAEPRVFVCRPHLLTEMTALGKRCGVAEVEALGADGVGSLPELAQQATSKFDPVVRASDDLAGILYTSGTTGRSKGAMLTHENLASNAEALRSTWRFTEEDVLLHALPIFHTHGLFVATNVLMSAGGAMIFLPGFNIDVVMQCLSSATSMMGVPTFYTRLLAREDFTAEAVKHMRVFISGSAPLSAETHKAFQERTGHAILERYGMTETGMNTSNPYDGDRRAGTVGFPLPGVEVRITDRDSGETLPQGEIGSIELRGANVFKGYWRMPDKTQAEFREDGFFISGDLGVFDERGYLSIVGRDKDLIISGGFNVYPAEVESALDRLEEIAENAVIGVPHPDFGEGVTAVVVAKNSDFSNEQEIRDGLAQSLAKYKVPKRVIFVDDLPRNAMGKIEKAKLRASYAALFQD